MANDTLSYDNARCSERAIGAGRTEYPMARPDIWSNPDIF